MVKIILILFALFIAGFIWAFKAAGKQNEEFRRLLTLHGFQRLDNPISLESLSFFQTDFFQKRRNTITEAWEKHSGGRKFYLLDIAGSPGIASANHRGRQSFFRPLAAELSNSSSINANFEVMPRTLPKTFDSMLTKAASVVGMSLVSLPDDLSESYQIFSDSLEAKLPESLISVLRTNSEFRFSLISGWCLVYRRILKSDNRNYSIDDSATLEQALSDWEQINSTLSS